VHLAVNVTITDHHLLFFLMDWHLVYSQRTMLKDAKSSEDRIILACNLNEMLQKPTRLSKRDLATLCHSHICVPHDVLGHFKTSLKTLHDFADILRLPILVRLGLPKQVKNDSLRPTYHRKLLLVAQI